MSGRGKRILFITSPFPPAKVPEADHALHECLHLADRGYDVHVLTTQRDSVAEPEGLTVHAIMERWTWWELPRAWRLARRLRADLHMLFYCGWLYDYRPMVLTTPTVTKIASPGSRFITKFSNIGDGAGGGDGWQARPRRLLFRMAGRWRYGTVLPVSDRIVALSEVHQNQLGEYWSGTVDKTILVPPPPILPIVTDNPGEAGRRGRKRLGATADEFLVTYFSRLYPGKGIETLLEAIAIVAQSRPNIRLAIVGGSFSTAAWFNRRGYMDELEARARDLGLTERTVWTGEYSWDSFEASEYLHGSDVVVLPFNLGVYLYNSSFAGALAHGVPIVATQGEIVEGPIVHRENVYLVPPKDAGAIAEAIVELMDDEALRSHLADGARKLAAEWFDWDRAIDPILGPYA